MWTAFLSMITPGIRKFLLWGAVVLLVFGSVSWTINKLASKGAELLELERQLAESRRILQMEHSARVADAVKAKEASQRIAALEQENSDLDEYLLDLKSAGDVCLNGSDSDRLRKLWK